jgi:hypothetical protein
MEGESVELSFLPFSKQAVQRLTSPQFDFDFASINELDELDSVSSHG